MDGSILKLPGKLDRLLHHGYNLPKGSTDEIPLIKGDLEKIIAISSNLENHNAMKARCWRKEVRELSYDLEDFLDQYEHAVQRIQRWGGRYSSPPYPKPTLQFCPWMKEWKLVSNKKEQNKIMGERKNKIKSKAALPWLREKLRLRLWMANGIREFSVRVQEALQRHSSYNLDAIDGSSSTGCTNAYSASGNSMCNEENTYVGIDAALEKLEELLMVKHDDRHHKLKIVSIVGFGGIGKTTLATELYRKFGLQFECRAFVRTAQNPDVRRIFISMLSQIRPHEPPDNWTVHGLISTIRTHLQDKRYLIIVEDLSATSTWDIVKCALPDSNCCSRILTTTEIEDLALQCCGHDPKHVYKMEPLGEENSGELFFSSVFGPQHECPPELKEISYDIVSKCGGLPLAIVTVASILYSQPATQDQWHYVNNSIGYKLLTNHSLEGMKQVLDLSYDNLPHHLKACILYTCLYEEDIIIYRDDLVNQWIAEGFIQATEGQDKKEIARSFFDRLISGKLILPVDINRNGEVLSCTVHHMVLNLVTRYKSTEENFVTAIHHSQARTTIADNVRRLSLQFGNAADAKAPVNVTLTHIRTLAIWGVFKCLPSVVQFPLLQVLILHFWGNKDSISFDITGISELFRLRYLKVTSNISLKLCTKMLSMQSLETLTIDARVSTVPSDIVHLPGLLHLSLPAETNLPNGIGNLTSLRMLGYFDLSSNSMENVQSLRMLTNIEDLQLTCSTVESDNLKEKMHFVLNSVFVTLRNLKSLTMVPRASSYAKSIDDAGAVGTTISVGLPSAPALLLQCLEVSPRICIFFCLPKWIGRLHKLCVLKFGVSKIDRDGVDILAGLPNLAVLSLYVHVKPEMGIVIGKTGFPVIKYFKFKCCDPCLKFEEGAMPNLRKLKLAFNACNAGQQNTIPVSINYLSELKEVSAKIGGAGPEESQTRAAKSAFRDAIRMHDRIQRVNIQSVKQIIFGNDDQSNITTVEDLPRSGEETMHFQNENNQKKEEGNRQRDAHFGLDIDKLQQVLKTRWLKPQEVMKILQNHELFTISHKPPQKPQSGSWFLFNRRVLWYFRNNDGFEWQKRRNGKTNEAHKRLKVDNVDALNCYYARGDKNRAFQRRIYWMLDPAYEHIVLAHYRDVLEGSISVSARNDYLTSNQNESASRAEVHSSPGWTSELIVQCPNSWSLGSADEVNSSESNLIQHKAVLRKLKMQLSLEDKEDCDVNADKVPANNEPIILPGIQNDGPDTSSNHDDISCCLSISETGAVSHGMLEKAALSIQKNFRCWKKRKEFLRIRNNVVRIQARVRAHQERKKYKELLSSVGVLEKVMIRWYRKGVGLRGFNSGAMPIDEEVDEDVAKVFRKLRVEKAIDEAVSRVSCIIGSPKAMQQYHRMLKRYQQAKDDHEN